MKSAILMAEARKKRESVEAGGEFIVEGQGPYHYDKPNENDGRHGFISTSDRWWCNVTKINGTGIYIYKGIFHKIITMIIPWDKVRLCEPKQMEEVKS